MLSRARLMLLLGLCGIAAAQTPATRTDIDPNSLSRFPIVPRSEMKTDADRAAYDYVVGTAPRTTPLLGPGGLSLYSPGSAESIERLNRYLRNDSVIGRRLFELCAIIGAWEIEQQYEWSGAPCPRRNRRRRGGRRSSFRNAGQSGNVTASSDRYPS